MPFTVSEIHDGMQTVTFGSWRDIYDFVSSGRIDVQNFIWRGQQDASWQLRSSFDRHVPTDDKRRRSRLARKHLSRFKLAVRGRRSAVAKTDYTDDDWWALAQHHAMYTPLLDWTESPFVALFFAFERPTPEEQVISMPRAVWGLGHTAAKVRELQKAFDGADVPTLGLVRPMQDENLRLVGQSGLFTKLPLGMTVEQWIGQTFQGDQDERRLVKMVIPDYDRNGCLRMLNQMNINHRSLFPDLYGAGKFCNSALLVPEYVEDDSL